MSDVKDIEFTKEYVEKLRYEALKTELASWKSAVIDNDNPLYISRDCVMGRYYQDHDKECRFCENGRFSNSVKFDEDTYTPAFSASNIAISPRMEEIEFICKCGNKMYWGGTCSCGRIYNIRVTLEVDESLVGNDVFWRERSQNIIENAIKYLSSEIAKMEAK